MSVQETVGEGLKEYEENVIGTWKKGDFSYIVEESLALMPAALTWKIRSISHQLDDLPKELSGFF